MKPHQKLIVWELSVQFVKEIYLITGSFPEKERFGIISQIQRSAISISANIAEGAGRQSSKEFIHFLYIALGSLSELDTLIILSQSIGYITQTEGQILQAKLDRIAKLLGGLIRKKKLQLSGDN